MNASARRISRVLELREKQLDDARRLLDAACARTAASARAVALARAELDRAHAALEVEGAVEAGDLALVSAHAISCERRVAAALVRVRECEVDETRARDAVNAARVRVRQIELWRAGVDARAAQEAEHDERKLHDALAARSYGGERQG